MNGLLKTILSLSLSGALLILVLFLCRPLVKDRLSKRWQYYIWLVVVARLLLPFAPETNLVGTIFQYLSNAVIQADANLQPKPEAPALPETDFSDHGSVLSPAGLVDSGGEPSESDTLTASGILDMAKQNIAAVLPVVWLLVASCLLIRKITVYQSFVRYINAGRIEISDIQLWERMGKLMEQTGVKGALGLYTNSLISSPLLIGFFRPCIVLPTTGLSESDFENTIRHELIHYRRRDMFYKWLVQVTVCLHWFNPLVHLMSREVNRACELSCDEAVIKSLDAEGRRAYGDTLLNAVAMGGSYRDSLASVTLNESAQLLKERLDAIMNCQKKSRFIVPITLLATILFCAAATTAGAYAAANSADYITPWPNTGGTGQSYAYSQAGYYQGKYLFELGWNLDEQGCHSYVDKAEITLSDLTVLSVCFDKSCKSEAQNQAVLSDLEDLMERLKTENVNSIPLKTPLVVSIKYVGDSAPAKLAAEYYTGGELTAFAAVFSALDTETQKLYCDKMMEDNKNAFLSSAARHMTADIIEYCAKKTYRENKTALFTNLVPYFTDQQKQAWAARASRDGKNTFLAVLSKGNPSTASTPPAVPSADQVRVNVTAGRSNNDQSTMETCNIGGRIYYQVVNEMQLRSIGQGEYGLNQNYIQMDDIAMSAEEWVPIGTEDQPFTGSYCGNGFEITGLTMTDPDAKIIGLFGVADGAHIYNITMRDYDIQTAGRNVTGKSIAPILATGLGDTRSQDNHVYPKDR